MRDLVLDHNPKIITAGNRESFRNGSSTLPTQDGQKEGKFTQWADSGQKITEGKYERNRKQGTWKRWNRQGKIQEKIQYVDGKIHGFRSLYDRDGILETELVYEAGELIGRKDELD